MNAFTAGVLVATIGALTVGAAYARAVRARADYRAAKAAVPVARKVWRLTLRRAFWRALALAAFVVVCVVWAAIGAPDS